MARVAASLAAVLAALALAACGGGNGAEPDAPQGATLVLDFQPNAVHAPLYYASSKGYFSEQGVELDIREPSSSADGAKLLEAGRADLAILDVNDLGIARQRGLELIALAAIVQRPLAAVIAADPVAVRTPADLRGDSVGVTGVPSDEAVLDTVLDAGGVPPGSVKRVTIGFTAVPALAGGRIAAATGFWNAEGVALRQQGILTREFRVDEFGAPRYPELVLVARGDGAPEDRELTCPVLRALGLGYRDLNFDPQRAIEAMLEQVDGLDPSSQQAQYAELIASNAFAPSQRTDPNPELAGRSIAEWVAWADERGVIEGRSDLRGGFLPGEISRCATDAGPG